MTFDESDMALMLSALAFAADKHRAQRRKDEARTPYINHPIEVAHTLWAVGGVRSVAVLAAALLHDVVEDSDATLADVEARFGPEVASLVREVTDDKSLPKATRKQLQIDTAPHKSAAAKQIKIADKIHNVHDVAFSPPPDWSPERVAEYFAWAACVVDGLRGANGPLEKAFDDTLVLARRRAAGG